MENHYCSKCFENIKVTRKDECVCLSCFELNKKPYFTKNKLIRKYGEDVINIIFKLKKKQQEDTNVINDLNMQIEKYFKSKKETELKDHVDSIKVKKMDYVISGFLGEGMRDIFNYARSKIDDYLKDENDKHISISKYIYSRKSDGALFYMIDGIRNKYQRSSLILLISCVDEKCREIITEDELQNSYNLVRARYE